MTVKRALILGTGGLTGSAKQTGALWALREFDPRLTIENFDRVIATSAGAVTAGFVSYSDLDLDKFQHAYSSDPEILGDLFQRLFLTAPQFLRAGVGSLADFLAAKGIPAGKSEWFRSRFPAGLFEPRVLLQLMNEHINSSWPDGRLWIPVMDHKGRREVFGREGAPRVSLPEAISAGIRIPGVYSPLRIGDKWYFDAGARYGASLDLAHDCDVVVAILPRVVRFTSSRRPSPLYRKVGRMIQALKANGTEVVLLSPKYESDIPSNLMSKSDMARADRTAYFTTIEQLRDPTIAAVLRQVAGRTETSATPFIEPVRAPVPHSAIQGLGLSEPSPG